MKSILRYLPAFGASWVVMTITCSAAALDATAWEYRQPISIPTAGPARVAIPAETLDAARADLADLRLLSPDGAELPFAIVRPVESRAPTTLNVEVQPRLVAHRTVIEFALPMVKAITRLTLVTPEPRFVKGVSVELRQPDGRWQSVIESAIIYRGPSPSENLAIAFDEHPATAVRLQIEDDRSAPVPFTAVSVQARELPAAELDELPVTIASVDQSAGETRLVLDFGLRHRALAELMFEPLDATFQRSIRLFTQRVEDEQVVDDTLAMGTLGRHELPTTRPHVELTLPVRKTTPSARLELLVENGDSPPLDIARVVARVHRVYLGFAAPVAGTYTLLSGAPEATAPRYDVAAFASEWATVPATDAHPSTRTVNSSHVLAAPPIEVPELAGAIDPSAWKHRRAVNLSAPGAQVLELDALALARCRSDLGDVRLARGTRQVPYLLERTTRQRSLLLPMRSAVAEGRPNVGRWLLTLPAAELPVTGVRLTIDEHMFHRRVELGEFVTDPHGHVGWRPLGSTAVTRRGAEDPGQLTVPISTIPRTNTLVVDIDHGDNPAFAPKGAEVTFAVRRVHFRATETTGIVLLTGNPTATAPRYDLQLTATRLLTAPQHTARLSDAEDASVNADSTRNASGLSGPVARYLFWGALAVTVSVLLWLVARLFPKPPSDAT